MLGKSALHLPAWHDVIDTGESVTDETRRWAMTYFINPAYLDTAPSAVETHTPLNLGKNLTGQID